MILFGAPMGGCIDPKFGKSVWARISKKMRFSVGRPYGGCIDGKFGKSVWARISKKQDSQFRAFMGRSVLPVWLRICLINDAMLATLWECKDINKLAKTNRPESMSSRAWWTSKASKTSWAFQSLNDLGPKRTNAPQGLIMLQRPKGAWTAKWPKGLKSFKA